MQPLPGTEPNRKNVGLGKLIRFVQIILTIAVIVSALQIFTDKSVVHFGDATIKVDVARTSNELTKGLSGRHELATDSGLLFVFTEDDYWAIWMKDMNFSIDIIWLDSEKRVVSVEKNVSPNTYPKSFVPSHPARYVLELPAGAADAKRIMVGQTAIFDL